MHKKRKEGEGGGGRGTEGKGVGERGGAIMRLNVLRWYVVS